MNWLRRLCCWLDGHEWRVLELASVLLCRRCGKAVRLTREGWSGEVPRREND